MPDLSGMGTMFFQNLLLKNKKYIYFFMCVLQES